MSMDNRYKDSQNIFKTGSPLDKTIHQYNRYRIVFLRLVF